MIIEIGRRDGRYHAMGHSVAIDEGRGEAELRRRCFEALSRLNLPPDEVRFKRLWAVEPALPDTVPPGPRLPSSVVEPAPPVAATSRRRR